MTRCYHGLHSDVVSLPVSRVGLYQMPCWNRVEWHQSDFWNLVPQQGLVLSKSANRAKYLGVTINNTLSWNSHIDIMTKKANNTTAFLRRNLSSCPADVKSTCYKTLVRPQLEYAATVWNPWTQTNISKIEAVQRRTARFTLGDYRRTSSVSSMLHQLKWDNLITRRHQSKVTMIYRVIHQLVAIQAVVLFALLVMISIWLFDDSVLSMETPTYFALLVSCNTWPWMVYLASMIFFFCLWFWWLHIFQD
jgi:hypothetical protein